MIIEKITVGEMQANCYLLACSKTKEAAIIDPGDEPARIKEIIRKHALSSKFIINTHGHADHIGANASLGLPVYIHRLDANFLNDASRNLSMLCGLKITSPKAAHLLEDNEIIKIGNLKIRAIHTPGHTPGSICLECEGILFSGDTLFCEGIGRTDFPGSSSSQLLDSINTKLMNLPDETLVHPGHGPSTKIGKEKRNNPFLCKI